MRENNNRHSNRPHNSDENFAPERNHSNISELAKKEQDHRHQWQDRCLRSHGTNFRIGQVFGFIYSLGLLYLVYDLIQKGEKILALQIFAISAGLLAFALVLTTFERKFSTRKPSKRNSRGRQFKGRGDRRERSDDRRERPERRRDDRR